MAMLDFLKTNSKIRVVFSVIVLAWILFIFLGFILFSHYYETILEKESNLAINNFSNKIDTYNNILENFSLYINADTLLVFEEEEFNLISSNVYKDEMGIVAISYAPSAIVEYVFPTINPYSSKNDDLLLGVSVIEHDLIEASVTSKENVFYYESTDDLNVIRLYKPIYVDDSFHGFVFLVINIDDLNDDYLMFGSDRFNCVILSSKNEIIIDNNDKDIEDLAIYSLEETGYPVSIGLYSNNDFRTSIIIHTGLYLVIITAMFLAISIYTFNTMMKTDSLIKKLNYQTDFDDHINIYNYQRMSIDIDKLIKENKEFYFAFGSINNLKYIFNKFGHIVGDKLLLNVIDKVNAVLSGNTKFYRYGGDEFVFIIESSEKFEVKNILERILRVFNSEIVVGKLRGNLSISLGVVNYPKQASKIDDLIVKADIVMSSTKSFNKNSYEFFKRESFQNIIHNQDFDTYLSSIPIEKFEVYLMPIVNTTNDKIRGFECLARLFDEFGNLLNIPDVISSFERNGRIQELDEYVFKKTCEYKVKLDTLFDEDYFLTTNVSGLSFNERYVNTIIDIYEHYDNLNNNIIVELTESNKFDDIDFLFKLYNKMTSSNIKLAIDDFGTGFSSLQSLSKTPLDIIKIDKSFIQGISDNPFNKQLIQIVQDFSKTLKIHVVAEGVDSFEQQQFIKEVGCKYYQGFLFSKALDIDSIIKLIKKENIDKKRGEKNGK